VRSGEHAAVRFASRPGKLYPGTIGRIEPQMNPADQTARVHVTFQSPPDDLAGSLFGEVSVIVGRKDRALLVPVSALLRDDESNTTSVMVVGADSLAHRVEVSVGIRRDSLAEVASPALRAGTVIVTEGHYGLPDSTKVRVLR
jgi:multidrug efflux pump subunit AcrA (membrane-fusion protein)